MQTPVLLLKFMLVCFRDENTASRRYQMKERWGTSNKTKTTHETTDIQIKKNYNRGASLERSVEKLLEGFNQVDSNQFSKSFKLSGVKENRRKRKKSVRRERQREREREREKITSTLSVCMLQNSKAIR